MKKGAVFVSISLIVIGAITTQIILTKKTSAEKPVNQLTAIVIATPTITPSPSPTPNSTPSPVPTLKPSMASSPSVHANIGGTKLLPSPSPSVEPTSTTSGNLDSLFAIYSKEYGISQDLLKKIAQCESNLNTNSVNGDYVGLFQYASNTWINTRKGLGLNSDPNLRTNAEESIRTAAYQIAHSGTGSWPYCSKI